MKNQKAFKILTLALTLAVLAIGFCFAAAAADEPSVSIIAKNVSYDDVVKVMFAVDDTKAGENEIELLYYLEDPTVNPNATAYKGTEYVLGYTDKKGTADTSDDVTYPAFYSAGFPAKHIGDKVYARAHIVDTEIYSDVVRYSVVEYLLERLYVDMATGDKKTLYEDLLSYGASAQKVLINGNNTDADDITKFVTDYVLVAIQGGTLDGKYSQGTYFVDDKVYPQADGIATWNATVYDLTTGAGTTTEVNGGAAYTVTGFTMFTAKAQGESPAPAYKPDLTDTEGRILWDEYANLDAYKTNGKIDLWRGSGAFVDIVDGAPYGESSKVVQMGTQSGKQDQIFIKTTKKTLNATNYIFETDIMVDPDAPVLYDFILRNGSVSTGRDAYKVSLSAGTDGNGQISGTGFATVSASGVCGQWFRLRLEYTDVSDTEAKVSVYYNDQKVAETSAFAKVHAAADLTDLYISASSTSVGDLYIDNTKAAEYTPPYIPDMSDLASRETYEDGDALNQFKWNSWHDNQGDSAYGIVDGKPYGTDSKVYHLNTKSGYKPEIAFEWTKVSTATGVSYESDMMLTTTGTLCPEMTLRENGPTALFTFYMKTTGDKVQLLDSGKNVIATIAEDGEWFRFRVEFINGDNGTANIKFYVNERLISSSYTATGSASAVGRFKLWTTTSETGDVYFDNTKVEFVTK